MSCGKARMNLLADSCISACKIHEKHHLIVREERCLYPSSPQLLTVIVMRLQCWSLALRLSGRKRSSSALLAGLRIRWLWDRLAGKKMKQRLNNTCTWRDPGKPKCPWPSSWIPSSAPGDRGCWGRWFATSAGRMVIDMEMEKQTFVNKFLLARQRQWDPEWNPISRTCRLNTWSVFFGSILHVSIWDALFGKLASHSYILAWEVAWTEEPGGLQSMESPRVYKAKQLKLIDMWNGRRERIPDSLLFQLDFLLSSTLQFRCPEMIADCLGLNPSCLGGTTSRTLKGRWWQTPLHFVRGWED